MAHLRPRSGCGCWFILGVALLTGCGDMTGPSLAPVSGTVAVAGQPLTSGSVSFHPDASHGNTSQHHPTGTINADGTYQLYTTGKKGAPPGWYKVLVFAPDKSGPNAGAHPGMASSLVHARYGSEKTTDLVIEVVPQSAPGAYDLTLSK